MEIDVQYSLYSVPVPRQFIYSWQKNIIAVFWSKVLHRPKLFAGCCFIVSLDFVFAEGRVPVVTGH